MYQVTLKNIERSEIIHSISSERNAPKIQGTIKKGINTIDEFTFKIKPNNIGFNLIKPFKTLVEELKTCCKFSKMGDYANQTEIYFPDKCRAMPLDEIDCKPLSDDSCCGGKCCK